MALSLSLDMPKNIYFMVSTGKDLFYVDKLRAIPKVELHIHISRETIEGYEFGRVDVDTIAATPDTEWYLCGNPHMVSETRENLTKRGFDKIYSEEFN